MSTEEIQAKVKEYILKEFLPGESPDNLTNELELISAGILDSLASLKIVAFLEETYGIEIESHEVNLENLNSIREITTFVQSKLK